MKLTAIRLKPKDVAALASDYRIPVEPGDVAFILDASTARVLERLLHGTAEALSRLRNGPHTVESGEPRLVEPVPGEGYRLLGTVEGDRHAVGDEWWSHDRGWLPIERSSALIGHRAWPPGTPGSYTYRRRVEAP